MESPYYEMTHDFEEENRLFQSGYIKGYHDAVMRYPRIVRCKDCINRYNPINCQMYSEGMNTSDDWFCADGKPKEGR